MLGLFGIFGRSHELQRLDQALLGVGLNPRFVPEAVKLTTLKLLGEAGAGPDPASCGHCHINRGVLQLGQIGSKFRPPCSRVAKRRTMWFEALCTWVV